MHDRIAFLLLITAAS